MTAERFFDAIAGRYDRVYALSKETSQSRMGRVLAELPPAPARVLDLGVGTGRELPALLDAGYEIVGLDTSAEMLARCARRARPIALVKGDFWRALPFEDDSFDAVIALHGTLAHPPNVPAMGNLAAELGRVTIPGGMFLAEAPSPAWIVRLAQLADTGERVVARTGALACTFEDRVAGATIDARILTDDEWAQAFSPRWTLRVEPLDELEWLVVGQRAR